jgi:hypothetical protein
MKVRIGILFVLAWCMPSDALAQQVKPRSPAALYSALLKEYNSAAGGIRTAKTDEQRRLHVERLGKFPARFLALAEKHPNDPVALKVIRQAIQAIGSTDSAAQIAWEINHANIPVGITDGSPAKVVALLRRDHLRSDQLGPVIDRMRYGYRMEFGEFFRTVLRKNPHREMQTLACLAWAQFLNDRLRAVRLAADRPGLAGCLGRIFGKNYLAELKQREQAGLAGEIEALFERATKFADVKTPRGGTVAAQAKMELHGIRHLSVGKVAPEIKGQDQDGRAFKLSDYRGRVVLLYFWMEY